MNKLPRLQRDAGWFEIITRTDEVTHRPMRVYRIACHKCGAENIMYGNKLSPDKMRKVFMRQGWEISKKPSAHICARCVTQRQIKALTPEQPALPLEPLPPPPPPPIYPHRLMAAWEKSPQEERDLFLELIAVKPVEIEQVDPVDPVIDQIEEDDEPADWWRQIEEGIRR